MTLAQRLRRSIRDHTDVEPLLDQVAQLAATVRALERRLAELERNEHGHCVLCGRLTESPLLERCDPNKTCVTKAAA